MGKATIRRLRDEVVNELQELGPYVYHNAYTTASCYIKFFDDRLRSLRISDHTGIRKYKYKWNIIVGGRTKEIVDSGVKRFFYSEKDLELFFNRIRDYWDTIQMQSEEIIPPKISKDAFIDFSQGEAEVQQQHINHLLDIPFDTDEDICFDAIEMDPRFDDYIYDLGDP